MMNENEMHFHGQSLLLVSRNLWAQAIKKLKTSKNKLACWITSQNIFSVVFIVGIHRKYHPSTKYRISLRHLHLKLYSMLKLNFHFSW